MNKSIAFLISVLLFLVAAQSSFAQMRSDPSGTWGGTMTTEVGTSGIELTLARKTSGWNATMKLRTIQGQELAPVISELEIKGADISFAAKCATNVVKFAGKFAGDKLNGTVEVYQDGEKLRSGTFALSFGAAMPSVHPTGGQMADPNFNAKVEKPAYK